MMPCTHQLQSSLVAATAALGYEIYFQYVGITLFRPLHKLDRYAHLLCDARKWGKGIARIILHHKSSFGAGFHKEPESLRRVARCPDSPSQLFLQDELWV